jgi:hypothetical protein
VRGFFSLFLAVACCSWLDLPHDRRLPVRSCDSNGRTVVAGARVGIRDFFWGGVICLQNAAFFFFSSFLLFVVCQDRTRMQGNFAAGRRPRCERGYAN